MPTSRPFLHTVRTSDERESRPRISDRLAVAQRPDLPVIGRQGWRHLLYLHWPASPEALRPLVPGELDLDLHDGRAWVSVVPFQAVRSRVVGLPRQAALDFHEVNVRTYVYRDGVPGVWFLSMDATSRLAVLGARAALGLPYHHANVSLRLEDDVLLVRAERLSGIRPQLYAQVQIAETAALCLAETLDHFLVERYVQWSRHLGRLVQTRIHHAPLQVRGARPLEVDDELVSAAGLPGYAYLPPRAHYVAATEVEIFRPER